MGLLFIFKVIRYADKAEILAMKPLFYKVGLEYNMGQIEYKKNMFLYQQKSSPEATEL